jgi:hypothetical protein
MTEQSLLRHLNILKPLPVLMKVTQLLIWWRYMVALLIWKPPSEQDHAHHAMKTVTKDATVQQGKAHDI